MLSKLTDLLHKSHLFREKCEPFEEKVCKQVLDQECTEIEKELCVNLDETVTEEICDDGKIENICEDQTEEVSTALIFRMTLGMTLGVILGMTLEMTLGMTLGMTLEMNLGMTLRMTQE